MECTRCVAGFPCKEHRSSSSDWSGRSADLWIRSHINSDSTYACVLAAEIALLPLLASASSQHVAAGNKKGRDRQTVLHVTCRSSLPLGEKLMRPWNMYTKSNCQTLAHRSIRLAPSLLTNVPLSAFINCCTYVHAMPCLVREISDGLSGFLRSVQHGWSASGLEETSLDHSLHIIWLPTSHHW